MVIDLDEGWVTFRLTGGDGAPAEVRVDACAASARLGDLYTQYPGDAQRHERGVAWVAWLMGECGFPKVSHGVAQRVARAVMEEAERIAGKPDGDSDSTASSGSTASGSPA